MSMILATHLKTSRHGIYYFRYTVPAPLRPHFGKKEVLYSLHIHYDSNPQGRCNNHSTQADTANSGLQPVAFTAVQNT